MRDTGNVQYSRPCVLKIGGSLLDWDGLPAAWRRWAGQRQAGICYWLVAGGGAWVDAIRAQQAARGWTDREAHELAIDCLAVTARVLAHRLELTCADFTGELREDETVSIAGQVDRVINVVPWLRNAEPRARGPRLPIGWSTTSDAIAARLAQTLGDLPLVLAKSCEPAGTDWQSWVEHGFVDRSFSLYSVVLSSLRAINLRAYG